MKQLNDDDNGWISIERERECDPILIYLPIEDGLIDSIRLIRFIGTTVYVQGYAHTFVGTSFVNHKQGLGFSSHHHHYHHHHHHHLTTCSIVASHLSRISHQHHSYCVASVSTVASNSPNKFMRGTP
jgi:hypothetical protein